MIQCDCHDHFEIACMHQSHVRVRLNNGQYEHGVADDIVTLNKEEFLIVKQGEEQRRLKLTEIERLEYDQQTIEIR